MVPHPHDDGPVERGVSLSMPAAVETVAARRHPGRSRDGAGPAELGEGGFRMNPIGVVAKDDQHLGGGVGTDAKALTQRRRGLGGESTQVTVVVHDLDGESEPATGERPEGMFRGIVKLTKTRLVDPQDDGLKPVVNRVCRGSVSPISLNLTIPRRA